jgi:hypothetical protein
MRNTDPHPGLFSNYELRTNHLSGSHTVPKGITTLLSVLSNFKVGKRTVVKHSTALASDSYDSGRGTSGINPLQPQKINVTFSSHITENTALIKYRS